MGEQKPAPDEDVQHQIDDLRDRADASDARADAAELRADVEEARADRNHERIGRLEERADIDRALVDELRAEGLVASEQVTHLQEALRSSRTIGAAIGIIMAERKVDETDAFAVLVGASQHANLKLRLIAEQVVRTGDLSELPRS